jgi:hypothetical protein
MMTLLPRKRAMIQTKARLGMVGGFWLNKSDRELKSTKYALVQVYTAEEQVYPQKTPLKRSKFDGQP